MSDAHPARPGGSADAQRPPIWNRPRRGSRGPAPTHSRDELVAAAVALADADGVAGVSMRAVATALGTSAGSLYRYLASRDDLLDLMTDHVLGELCPYPEVDGDWLASMILVARDQWALYRRHPWLVDVIHRPSAVGPRTLAWFDHCLRVLAPLPVSATTLFEAIGMMTGVVTLFARSEAAAGSLSFAGVDLTAYPHLVAAFSRPPGPASPSDLFDRTLRALLTGLLTG